MGRYCHAANNCVGFGRVSVAFPESRLSDLRAQNFHPRTEPSHPRSQAPCASNLERPRRTTCYLRCPPRWSLRRARTGCISLMRSGPSLSVVVSIEVLFLCFGNPSRRPPATPTVLCLPGPSSAGAERVEPIPPANFRAKKSSLPCISSAVQRGGCGAAPRAALAAGSRPHSPLAHSLFPVFHTSCRSSTWP